VLTRVCFVTMRDLAEINAVLLSFRLRQLEVLAEEIPNRHGIEQWKELLIASLGPEAKNFDCYHPLGD